ncbi:MAG: DUF1592 domain-containing protein [Zavarzinella sp.]
MSKFSLISCKIVLCLAAFGVGLLDSQLAANEMGKLLYAKKCAFCHGANGEGTKKYEPALTGGLSVAQLADVIQKTMPEDSPGSLSKSDASAISDYVHDAFYSPVAQERNRPARIQLSRLTVKQYRNSLADLVNSFTYQPNWGKEPGLRAEYFKNRRTRATDRVAQRIDPQIDFQFGTESPVPGKTEPHEFSIWWRGSVLAPETGMYEIVARTEHAVRVYLNDPNTPLIDAWVKSGNDTEYRGRIFLIAGQVYPLKVDFSKAKQGVDDSDKTKNKPPPKIPAMMTLLWQPPQRTLQVIPNRLLCTCDSPIGFASSVPFPPDDRSLGWERGTAVTREWDAATTEGAIETADFVLSHLRQLANTSPGQPDARQKLITFSEQWLQRAFREPLKPEWKALIASIFEQQSDPTVALKRVLLFSLKSPRFLYRDLEKVSPSFQAAERLSYALWDSIPDQQLWTEAAAGRLVTREQVTAQARRMLNHLRAKEKVEGFLLAWLNLDQPHDLTKDAKLYPNFNAQIGDDLRTSLELFLRDTFWSNESNYKTLLSADKVYLNDKLSKYYGFPVVKDFQPVAFHEKYAAGVLTHPYMMSSFAHHNESSPIHRGVFIARGLLGVMLRPPPEAVTPLPPDLHPSLNTRERVILQTKSANCMTCHGIINQLGFTLENFDSDGKFRTVDRAKPVDTKGSYITKAGKEVTFQNARDVGQFVANNPEAHAAFCEKMFHHVVQQPIRAFGADKLSHYQAEFTKQDFNMQHLVLTIAVDAAMHKK